MRIAVFGATGNAGRHITRLLLGDPANEVTACARSAERLRELQATPGPSGTLQTNVVDVDHEPDVRDIASASDLVVGVTSRSEHGPALASIAAECGASYIGAYLSDPEKWRALRRLHDTCVARGVMVVDDGGCHPGVPAAMIRWAAERGGLDEAWVGAKFGLAWDELDMASETVDDFLAEIEATDPSVFVDGEWVRGYRHARQFDFERGDGPESCIPVCLEEIRELAESGTVASTGFFMAGFGTVMDYGVLPVSMGLAKVHRKSASGLLAWGLRRFASTAEHGDLLLEARGTSDGQPIRMRVAHPDPYVLTAVPVVAAIRQMATRPQPGVWTQAGFVDPSDFFEDLRVMGVSVET